MKNIRLLRPEQREKILQMDARAKHLTLYGKAPNGQPWGTYLQQQHKEFLALADDAERAGEQAEQFQKLFKRIEQGDMEAKQEFMELKIERVTNYLVNNLNFGRFFEVRTLGEKDSPAIQNNSKNQMNVKYVGQDGGHHETQVAPLQQNSTVDLKVLATEEVEFIYRDIYTGDLTQNLQSTFDLQFDLDNQLDKICFDLLDTIFGNFTLTGAKAGRVYVPNTRIRSGVLPTKNNLLISDVGATLDANSKFGQPVFEALIDYCARFARTDSAGDLMPTGELVVAAQDCREIISGLEITAAQKTEVGEFLLKNGWFNIGEILGVNWNVIPDNTIARKKLYARLNKPVGILWLKPSMADGEMTVDRRKNLAKQWMKICIGLAIPKPNEKNAVTVTYRT